MEPSVRRTARHRSRLPGREVARLDTVARSAHRDYADIWWRWSLRDDGSAWYRLARVWYWRPVPHRARREPPLWRQVAQLDSPGTADQGAAELLAKVACGHGHYPAGSEPQPQEPVPSATLAAERPPVRQPRRRAAAGFARALRMIFVGVTGEDVAEAREREKRPAPARRGRAG